MVTYHTVRRVKLIKHKALSSFTLKSTATISLLFEKIKLLFRLSFKNCETFLIFANPKTNFFCLKLKETLFCKKKKVQRHFFASTKNFLLLLQNLKQKGSKMNRAETDILPISGCKKILAIKLSEAFFLLCLSGWVVLSVVTLEHGFKPWQTKIF